MAKSALADWEKFFFYLELVTFEARAGCAVSFLLLLVFKFRKIFQAADKLKSCVLDVRLPLFFAGNTAQQLVLKANFGLKSRMNILSTLYSSAVNTACAGSPDFAYFLSSTFTI